MKYTLYICMALAVLMALCGPSQAEIRSSGSFSIEVDAITGGGATCESSSYKVENSSIGESFQGGSAESTNYKVYGQFQECLCTSPDAPANLMQYRANGVTVIATGEWINADTVVFKFTMFDRDPSGFLTPQIELRATTDAFTGTPNYSGYEVWHRWGYGAVTGIVTVSSISSDIAYHWQARAIDDDGRPSNWVSFGGNPESAIDFGVDMTPPTIEVISPDGGEYWGAFTDHDIQWTAGDASGITAINIMYSTDEGATWIALATGESNDGALTWTLPDYPTTEALVRITAVNGVGLVMTDESDATFRILGPLFQPMLLTAESLPAGSPDHVHLFWTASTAEAVQGYNLYRGLTYEVYNPTPLNGSLITGTSTDDLSVYLGTDYYYAVKAYSYGRSSPYSNCASAPLMEITRTSTVESPVSGGYTGGLFDAVPGATIKYSIKYHNIGFGKAARIILNDRIPNYTDYKIDSATGEAVNSIRFSSDDGEHYYYTPSGTKYDPLVTNISWEVQPVSSNASRLCTYEVIIR